MDTRCNNVFSAKALLSQYQVIVVISLNVIIMLLVCAANMMVIVSLIATKQLESKINRMFLALSICDICVAVIVQPSVALLFVIKRDHILCDAELTIQALSLFFPRCSAFFIVAIGVERLLSVKSTNVPRRSSQISYKRPYLLMTLGFLASLALAACVTFSSIYGFFYVAQFIILIIDFFALVTVYSAYIEMYRSVMNHVKDTAILRKNNTGNSTAYAAEMVKAIMIIIFFLFLSYIPYISGGVVICHKTLMRGELLDGTYGFITYVTHNLVYLNSFFNPVIVLYKNKRLYRYIKEKLLWSSDSFAPNTSKPKLNSILKPVSNYEVTPRI